MPIGGVDGNGLYGRQTLRGNLAYGGGPARMADTPVEGAPATPSTPLMGQIGRRLAELLPKAAHARIIRSWAGVIENTPDGRPVIDRLPSVSERRPSRRCPASALASPPPAATPSATWCSTAHAASRTFPRFALARFADLEPNWRDLQGWKAKARPESRSRLTALSRGLAQQVHQPADPDGVRPASSRLVAAIPSGGRRSARPPPSAVVLRQELIIGERRVGIAPRRRQGAPVAGAVLEGDGHAGEALDRKRRREAGSSRRRCAPSIAGSRGRAGRRR